jgi:hypothetical protein
VLTAAHKTTHFTKVFKLFFFFVHQKPNSLENKWVVRHLSWCNANKLTVTHKGIFTYYPKWIMSSVWAVAPKPRSSAMKWDNSLSNPSRLRVNPWGNPCPAGSGHFPRPSGAGQNLRPHSLCNSKQFLNLV